MFRTTVLLIFLFLSLTKVTLGQDSIRATKKIYFKDKSQIDVSLSYIPDRFAGSAAWTMMHGFGKKNQAFKIGYGIRYTGFVAGNSFYTTAPAKYTSTAQDISTMFSDNIPGNIDTLSFVNSSVHSINLAIYLQYTFFKKVDIGFNIDLGGLSFGPTEKSSVISGVYDAGQSGVVESKPTLLNAMLTSDNDIGTLNSEIWAGYRFHPQWKIRAGYTFHFSEQSTSSPLSFDGGRIQNERYRLKSGMIMIGVSFQPFVMKN